MKLFKKIRNELTEIKRNKRHAGFELLKETNQLQLLIDYAYYDKDTEQGSPITGWGHLMYVKDMSTLISANVVAYASQPGEIRAVEWVSVYDNSASNQRITEGMDALRSRVRRDIKAREGWPKQ